LWFGCTDFDSRECFAFPNMRQVTQSLGIAPPSAAAADAHADIQNSIEVDADEAHTPSRFGVCGLWFVVCGLWFVVCGLWFVVCRCRIVFAFS
jgi:hypothetical protein